MPKRSESPEDRGRGRSPKRTRRDRSPSNNSGDDDRRRRQTSDSPAARRKRSPSLEPIRATGHRSASPPQQQQNGDYDNAAAADPPAAQQTAAAPEQRKPKGTGRAGGAYIPPFRLAQQMAEIEDKDSPAYQRLTWDALRKSINGLVNKINAANIKHILPEVFAENLLRGRGLLCRSLMKSQTASPSFTPVYAALVAVINTKFPEIGELLLHRVVTQFKRSYRRNDKPVCLATLTFIAHLVNQQVVHEVLALEIALLLLETPSDDGVEVCSEFVKQCGAMLQDLSPAGLTFVFDRLRAILHEGISVSKRTQYIIEGLYAVRKAGFNASGFPAVPKELDLVETADQITHEIGLEDSLTPQMHLDVFKEDPEYRQHEEEYAAVRREILGEESGAEEDSGEEGEEGSSSEEEDEEEEEGREGYEGGGGGAAAGGPIQDHTGTDLVNLRRTIYLTIMSALDFEEAGHKLLRMGIPEGLENELATMIIECCSQEKTFIKYYALLAERFCKLGRVYSDCFADCFIAQYRLIHRLETNKLRNVAKMFAHLLATDALPWAVLSVIRLTEEDTTSSSRIFVKTLFQELAETMGLRELNARLDDPDCAAWFTGVFPQDTPRNMRFAINFFTSIGLGGLTDRMRETLKDLPRLLAEQQALAAAEAEARRKQQPSSSSDTSSGSDTSTDSDSSSDSGSDSSTSSSGSDTSSDSSGSDSEDGRRRGRGRSGGRRSGGSRRSPPPSRRRGEEDREREAPRKGRSRSRSASRGHRRRQEEGTRGRRPSPSPPPRAERRVQERSKSPALPPSRRDREREEPPRRDTGRERERRDEEQQRRRRSYSRSRSPRDRRR